MFHDKNKKKYLLTDWQINVWVNWIVFVLKSLLQHESFWHRIVCFLHGDHKLEVDISLKVVKMVSRNPQLVAEKDHIKVCTVQ